MGMNGNLAHTMTNSSASMFIVVSGQPPMLREPRYSSDGHLIGWSAGSCDLAHYGGTKWRHCSPCNKALRPTDAHDNSLGFPLCTTCARTWQERCEALHGRLPFAGEFFCLGCLQIKGHGLLARKYGDGRQRWRCMTCRGKQRAWRPEWNANRQARRHGLL
jgi:hypothetical protein